MSTLEELSSLYDGRYTVGKILGTGGFGVTYSAFDTVSGCDVAIKEYMPTKLAEWK